MTWAHRCSPAVSRAQVLRDAVEHLRWRPDGALIAVGAVNGELALVDGKALRPTTPPTRCRGAVSAIAWSPTGTHLAVATDTGDVLILNGDSDRTVAVEAPITALAWSPTGDLLAVGTAWSLLTLTDDGDILASVGPLEGGVHGIAWAPGPGPLAAATGGGLAWCQVGSSGEPVEVWPSTGLVRCLSADRTHERLAYGDLGGVLRVVDVASQEELSISGFAHRIGQVAWTPSGTHLAVPEDDTVVLWHLRGIELVSDEPTTLEGHDGVVVDLAFDPDTASSRLASISAHGGLRIDTLDQSESAHATALDGSPRCLDWRPGRPEVAVGDGDGALHLVAAT